MKLSKMKKALTTLDTVGDILDFVSFELDADTEDEVSSKLEQIMEAIQKVHELQEEYAGGYTYPLDTYQGVFDQTLTRIKLFEEINKLTLLLPNWRLKERERASIEAKCKGV